MTDEMNVDVGVVTEPEPVAIELPTTREGLIELGRASTVPIDDEGDEGESDVAVAPDGDVAAADAAVADGGNADAAHSNVEATVEVTAADEPVVDTPVAVGEPVAAPVEPVAIAPVVEDEPTPAPTPEQVEAAEWQAVETWGMQRAVGYYEQAKAQERTLALAEGLTDDEIAERLTEKDTYFQQTAWTRTREDYRGVRTIAEEQARALRDPLVRAIAPTLMEKEIAPIVARDVAPVLARVGLPADFIKADELATAMVDAGLWEQWQGASAAQKAGFIAHVCKQRLAEELWSGAPMKALQEQLPVPAPKPAPKPPAQIAPDSFDTTTAPMAAPNTDPAYGRRKALMMEKFAGYYTEAEIDALLQKESKHA